LFYLKPPKNIPSRCPCLELIHDRSLSLDNNRTKSVIEVQKNQIDFHEFRYEENILDEFLSNVVLDCDILHLSQNGFQKTSHLSNKDHGKRFENVETRKRSDYVEIEVAWFPIHIFI
jgi:hypothetical protein